MTQTTPHKRLTPEQWQTLIIEQQNSSMTQSEFCQSKGVGLATFYKWKSKLNPVEKATPEVAPDWVELSVTGQSTPQQRWNIELELPGNVILRMRQ